MKKLLSVISFLIVFSQSYAQFNNTGFTYQASVADDAGVFYAGTPVLVRTTLYEISAPSQPIYQETQAAATSSLGTIVIFVGEGNSTGAGSFALIESIPFESMNLGMRVELDVEDDGSYDITHENDVEGVPYVFHSRTVNPVALNSMSDLDTTTLPTNGLLVWNGTNWEVQLGGNNNGGYANSAGTSTYADTVNFAYTMQSINDDTAQYAYHADTAIYSPQAGNVANADTAYFADTASYAFTDHAWGLTGDTSIVTNEWLGSENNQPMAFRANGVERMLLDTAGRLYQNGSDSTYDYYVNGSQGVGMWLEGDLDSGTHVNLSPGLYFHYSPKLGSLHVGSTVDTLWDESNTGKNSFAFGRNSWTSGEYSMAFGDSCRIHPIAKNGNLSLGKWAFAGGKNTVANGRYNFAFGNGTEARVARSMAIGRECLVDSGYSCIAMGDRVRIDARSVSSWGFGQNITIWGPYNFGLGANVSILDSTFGCFVYGDASTLDTVQPTGNHQFVVRGAGGAVFYTDTAASVGVMTSAGSGAWATVSDRNKKENFQNIDVERTVQLLRGLDVTAWNYKTQDPNIIHIGPMAQDLYSLFGYGGSDTTITTTDIDGLTLIGIQGLSKQTRALQMSFAKTTTDQSTASLQSDYSDMNARLDALELIIEQLDQ